MDDKLARESHGKMDTIFTRIQAIKANIFSDPAMQNLFDIASRIHGAKTELEYIDSAMSSNPGEMLDKLNNEMDSLSSELHGIEKELRIRKKAANKKLADDEEDE